MSPSQPNSIGLSCIGIKLYETPPNFNAAETSMRTLKFGMDFSKQTEISILTVIEKFPSSPSRFDFEYWNQMLEGDCSVTASFWSIRWHYPTQLWSKGFSWIILSWRLRRKLHSKPRIALLDINFLLHQVYMRIDLK